jgi:hypothetical protein
VPFERLFPYKPFWVYLRSALKKTTANKVQLGWLLLVSFITQQESFKHAFLAIPVHLYMFKALNYCPFSGGGFVTAVDGGAKLSQKKSSGVKCQAPLHDIRAFLHLP